MAKRWASSSGTSSTPYAKSHWQRARPKAQLVGKLRRLAHKSSHDRSRATAEVVRRAEAATAAAVAEAAAQGEAEAADARKTWRGGEAARRQRFLAKKADDARAQTLKGLEPEVEAIMSKHRATLRRLKGEHDVALAALRAEAAQAAEAGAARAAAEGAAALGRRLDSEAAAFRQRVDQLARAQEGRLRELQREQQQELEDVRRGHRDGACVRTHMVDFSRLARAPPRVRGSGTLLQPRGALGASAVAVRLGSSTGKAQSEDDEHRGVEVGRCTIEAASDNCFREYDQIRS